MKDDAVNLFDLKKYRSKRYISEASKNPVEEISNTIHGLFEEIVRSNKRYKPEVNTEFKCDLFRFEDCKPDNQKIYNLINPQINVNIHINNPNPIYNNTISISNNEKKKLENGIKTKIISENESINNQNHSQSRSIFGNDDNNNIFGIQKNEENKKQEQPSTLFSLQRKYEKIPEKSNTQTGQGNILSNISLHKNEEKEKKEFSSTINIQKTEKKPFAENTNNMFGQGNPFGIISNSNLNPSNLQIQLNLPINNNSSIQNNTKPSQPQSIINNQIAASNDVSSASNPSKAFQNKLISMSENYNNIKSQIEKINQNSTYKNNINNIIDNINLKFNQISTEDTIQAVANEAIIILKQLERSNQDDLYIYTLDYICKRVITKAEGYSNDKKINIYRLSKIVSILDKNISIFGDYFISILTFRCPFLVPKIFLKKDCKSEDEYSKKMGFAYVTQNAVEHLSDMECHSYLFFGFIQQDINKKYAKYVEFFTYNLFSESCIYPLAAVINAFLDAFGSTFKEKYENIFNEFSQKIVDYLKNLENVKNNCKSSDIKSKINTFIHFIKKNLDCIKKNLPTTMFKQ